MKKGIRNADTVTCKLRPTLIRATNNRLKVARDKSRKRKNMMERRRAEAMAVKWRRTRGGISLSSKEKD